MRVFSQRHETQSYLLKQFIINRSTIAKLKLPNDKTVWFHLLTSPLVITSCQNGFLYSALATSSGSNLKNKKEKEKTKQNKKNKTVHQIVNDSSIVPSLVKGMSMCTDFAIDDIYILTKRSEGNDHCSLYKCRIYQIYSSSAKDVLPHVMPSLRPSCSRTNTNSEIIHTYVWNK